MNQLVLKVLSERGLDPATADVHVGIDGGQNMLKVGVTITERIFDEQLGRSSYSQVIKISVGQSILSVIYNIYRVLHLNRQNILQ